MEGANVAVLGRALISAPLEVVLNAVQSPKVLKDNVVVERVHELEWGDSNSPGSSAGRELSGEPSRASMKIEWIGVKLPVVSKRDFCTCTHLARYKDNSVVVSAMSLHVEQHVPFYTRVKPREGYERGRVLVGGWHLAPAPNTAGATVGTWVNVSNPGGHLPQMLLKMGWSKSSAVERVAAVKVLAEEMFTRQMQAVV
eukprot:TRINITY_DN57881_c0_g1_i1.p1 TRINITY_DN57881_c0_g1~~TRINITY_DN57881_c0_g1_i1.p1  ORF type:complete len:198 (-),score=34.83 TRINITY_DN57881_c0_g1_i1:227-820(-)